MSGNQELQQLFAASFRAWGKLVDAWSEAVTGLWATVAQGAHDEVVYVAVNQRRLMVRSDRAVQLHAPLRGVGPLASVAVPADQVIIDPPSLPAMAADAAPLSVVVTVLPGGEVVRGTYMGPLVDEQGAQVEPVFTVRVSSTTP